MKNILFFLIVCISLTSCKDSHANSVEVPVTYTNDTTNMVYLTYSGTSVSAVVCENIKNYVTITSTGSHVRVIQSQNVGLSTGEINYELTGTSANGSFYMEGAYKSTVGLRALTLTNPNGPAIDIQNGKRVEISIKRDTENTLTDGTSTAVDAWKGCLQCKGHVEFKGYGTLNVYGNYANAIWSKEYMTVRNCTINVLKAVKDGINCNQYFSMESGVVNISGQGDDGISVGLKNNDTSAENTGSFTMTGGTININPSGASGTAVNALGNQSVASSATLNTSWTQSVSNVSDGGKSVKVLREGQVLIIRNGRTYTPNGNLINN